jgi:hypothetical protein
MLATFDHLTLADIISMVMLSIIVNVLIFESYFFGGLSLALMSVLLPTFDQLTLADIISIVMVPIIVNV